MRQLSDEQKEAVNAVDGQVLVVSCPGSGKTTTLIARIKHMLDIGIDPNSMLNITFTKAAAAEMESRFASEHDEVVKFSTIHSFCFRVLCSECGMTRENILKESEKWKFIFDLLSESKKVRKSEVADMTNQIIQEISYVKNCELNPGAYSSQCCERDVFYNIFKAYEEYKKNVKKIDLDDMLIMVRDCFKNDPKILEKLQQTYRYISIDEFQDVNKIQAEIAYMLAGPTGNLFVVGDDDQSIYKFRAADSSIMLNFPKEFPNSKTIYMGTNYRSGKSIVKLAGNLISNNKKRFSKDFKAYREDNGNIFLSPYESIPYQAYAITEKIKKMRAEGIPYEDIAILYRTNSSAVPFISFFMKDEIPFYTSEVPKSHHGIIYEEILAYYRLSRKQEKKGDLQKILNSPSRYLTASNFRKCPFKLNDMLRCCDTLTKKDEAKEKIFEMMQDIKEIGELNTPKEIMDHIGDRMGYRSDLKKRAQYYGKPDDEYTAIYDLLYEEGSQFDQMDDWMQYVQYYEKKLEEVKKDKRKKGVCLSTFHASKGLEWDKVFVVNANDGQTPFSRAETPEELEEERRMFYVAITRAKTDLYMSYIESAKTFPTPYFDDMGLRINAV